MSCIITYKGQKYSEEQFKEYFINNKQEFTTSIAKNKNVIDSFKRKMEGIDYVFSQSPELASIGNKAQYLQYLSTIFKTSKVKDIVYHGTPDKGFDKFDKSKLGFNTEAASATKGFFFTDSVANAKTYVQKVDKNWAEKTIYDDEELFETGRRTKKTEKEKLIDKEIENSDFIVKESPYDNTRIFDRKTNKELITDNEQKEYWNFIEEINSKIDKQLAYKYSPYSVLLNAKNIEIYDKEGQSGNINGLLIKAIENKKDSVEFQNFKDPFISNVYVVFNPEQIHILGSKQDIENFKKFVGQPINKEIKPNEYTNHSGGAEGSDIQWDKIGKEFGFVNNKHYWTETKTPHGNTEITKEDFEEGRYESAKAAKRNFGYQYATMKDSRLIRNWSQVKHSDAIFAIGKIVNTGEKLFPNQTNDTRVATNPSVTGGTGYAVGMGINKNKPVYVFNQSKSNKYDIGWYKWDNNSNDFIKTETPILTKNFAGIGTREINDLGKQAIRNVYEKTFNKTQEQPIVEEKPLENPDYDPNNDPTCPF